MSSNFLIKEESCILTLGERGGRRERSRLTRKNTSLLIQEERISSYRGINKKSPEIEEEVASKAMPVHIRYMYSWEGKRL